MKNLNTDAVSDPLNTLTQSRAYKGLAHLPVWSAIDHTAVVPAITARIDAVRQAFQALEADTTAPTWHSLMVPLERLERDLSGPSSRINHLQSVSYQESMKEAYDQVRPKVVELMTEMNQSRPIYDRLQQLVKEPTLSATRRRIVEQTIKAMQRSGVHLEGDAQKRFQVIQQSLSDLQQRFQNHLVAEAKVVAIEVSDPEQVQGLPDALLDVAAAKAVSVDDAEEATEAKKGPWSFSVSGANYLAIMEQCDSPRLRENMYRQFKARGTASEYDNRPILEEILSLRHEKARLLGFDHYADFSLDSKMAPSLAAVRDLLTSLKRAAIPAAEQELEALKAFIETQQAGASDNLKPWDVTYWVERYRQAYFNIDQERVRQYLQVPKVMQALFDIMASLFDLDIQSVPQGEVPTWHEDVEFYEVREKGVLIAGFFMDPFARTGLKREGAWMNTVVDRSEVLAPEGCDASLPVALFVMNARPPQQGKPGLFSLNDAETLFHEFGHALQHMLTRVNEGAASGINMVEWDAVEIASQFNENWLYQRQLLKSVSQHVDTGEALDDETIEKIIESRYYWAGNATLRQLLFALSDLAIHEEVANQSGSQAASPYAIEKAIRAELIQTPYLDDESQLPAFSHLFAGGYAAGYYSYKWAEVMSADAFGRFEEAGLDNMEALKPIAQHYRETILAKGGSQPAIEVFRAYRGRDATVDALLKQQGLL